MFDTEFREILEESIRKKVITQFRFYYKDNEGGNVIYIVEFQGKNFTQSFEATAQWIKTYSIEFLTYKMKL